MTEWDYGTSEDWTKCILQRIAEMLMMQKAKLHKSYRNKFSNMKLNIAEKRERQEEPAWSPQRSKFTRAYYGAAPSKNPRKAAFSVEVLRKCVTKPWLLI